MQTEEGARHWQPTLGLNTSQLFHLGLCLYYLALLIFDKWLVRINVRQITTVYYFCITVSCHTRLTLIELFLFHCCGYTFSYTTIKTLFVFHFFIQSLFVCQCVYTASSVSNVQKLGTSPCSALAVIEVISLPYLYNITVAVY